MLIATSTMAFVPRATFPEYRLALLNFKGHHQKALTKFGHLAPQVDLIVEVRDSRAPIATTNVLFDRVLARKKKIVLYTKKDLLVLKPDLLRRWHGDEKCMFIDARSRRDAHGVLDAIKAVHGQMQPPPPLGLRAMIIGMPNVGKSTLVNTLRDVGYAAHGENRISTRTRKVARTGGQPGVTRNTSEIIRLSRDPDILVYDTPGVNLPTVKDLQTMLALGLVGCIHSSFVDPVIQADYLLYVLNLQGAHDRYREYLDRPTNNISELLFHIAKTRKKLKADGSYDELGMASHWVGHWRQGKFKQHRGLFDVPAILDAQPEEVRKLLRLETERVSDTAVHSRIALSLGADGTGTSKHRNRTAKDREYDLRNQLFKL